MSCLREGLVVQTRGRATRHSKVDTLAVIFRRLWGCGGKNSSQEVNLRPEVLDIFESKIASEAYSVKLVYSIAII